MTICMIIHRFLLIESRSACISILSDAYSCPAPVAAPLAAAAPTRAARRASRSPARPATPARSCCGCSRGIRRVARPPRCRRARRRGAPAAGARAPLGRRDHAARSPTTLARDADVVFLALPDAAAAELAPALVDAGVRVIDLSGAFRLRDAAARARWYPETARAARRRRLRPHRARARRRRAARGSSPTRAAIRPRRCWRWRRSSRPGCCVAGADIIVDAKSGVSGAGKTPSERTHFSEVPRQPVGLRRVRPPPRRGNRAGRRRDGDVHAAPGAARPRHSRDDLRARARRARPKRRSATSTQRAYRGRAVRPARRARRCRKSSTSRTRISATSAGASTRRAARSSCRSSTTC